MHWDAKLCAQAMHNVSFSKFSNLNQDNFNLEMEKKTSFLASNHFLGSLFVFEHSMEGLWMWSYQMCEGEILQGSGNGHTHAYSNQLVPKNSNVWPRIFLVSTLWTVNQMEMMCLKTNIVSFSVQCRVKGKVFCDECWEIDCDKLTLQWCILRFIRFQKSSLATI